MNFEFSEGPLPAPECSALFLHFQISVWKTRGTRDLNKLQFLGAAASPLLLHQTLPGSIITSAHYNCARYKCTLQLCTFLSLQTWKVWFYYVALKHAKMYKDIKRMGKVSFLAATWMFRTVMWVHIFTVASISVSETNQHPLSSMIGWRIYQTKSRLKVQYETIR